jgi:hypothetical protein
MTNVVEDLMLHVLKIIIIIIIIINKKLLTCVIELNFIYFYAV